MIHTLQVTLIAITCLTIDCVRSEHHLLSLVGIYASTYERVQMWVENSVISWGIPILFSTWLNLRTLFAGPTEPTVQLCSLLAASILLLCFCTIFLRIVNTNSVDCKEGHMKKNSLCVCLFASGSKEHRFLWNQWPRCMTFWTSSDHTLLNMGNSTNQVSRLHGDEPIRFQGSMAMSQSDFGNVEN